MKRKSLILLLAALLVMPVLVLSSCASKQVKEQVGPTEAELSQQQLAAEAKRKFENELIHFDFDKYNIRPDAQSILTDKADYLRSNPNYNVQIDGHCDNRGTEAYNLALGDRRAKSSKRYLESLGVDGSRMSTFSYGEDRPLDPANNETAWALNRRCEFTLK